jgi:hypothetical protein
MLTDKEIDIIIKKERLTKADVYLINHHIDSIKKMNEDYPNGVPSDVFDSTQRDLKKIIDRLLLEREHIKQSALKDNKNIKKNHLRLVDTK